MSRDIVGSQKFPKSLPKTYFWEVFGKRGQKSSRKKNYKGRCEKRKLNKVDGLCITYDRLQTACADYLSIQEEIVEIRCNVYLEGLGGDSEYTSDFVCRKKNGTLMVRECVFRKHLTKPMTARLLEESRSYWERHGVIDWGIVTDEEK